MIAAGLDVGRKRDRSALVMIQDSRVFYAVAIRGLSLPAQRQWVAEAPYQPDLIAVDATGIGLGLAEGGLSSPVLAVTITGSSGGPSGVTDGACTVGKLHLVGLVAKALRERTLAVAPRCLGRDELRAELEAMVVGHTATGRIKAEARADHDDLVLALALALLARDMLLGENRHGTQQAA